MRLRIGHLFTRCFSSALFIAAVVLVLPATTHAAPADTDGDGLIDDLEIAFQTDVNKPDTDGDGFSDGVEIAFGYSPTSREPVKLSKQIVIDLGTYRLARYLGGVKLDEFPISPGLPRTPTPIGEFKVHKKHTKAWSRSSKLWMPFWMNFVGPGAPTGSYGIHELPYWPGGRREGERSLGRPASHGCVRLGIGAAQKVYDWAPEGTSVIIRRSEAVARP